MEKWAFESFFLLTILIFFFFPVLLVFAFTYDDDDDACVMCRLSRLMKSNCITHYTHCKWLFRETITNIPYCSPRSPLLFSIWFHSSRTLSTCRVMMREGQMKWITLLLIERHFNEKKWDTQYVHIHTYCIYQHSFHAVWLNDRFFIIKLDLNPRVTAVTSRPTVVVGTCRYFFLKKKNGLVHSVSGWKHLKHEGLI